MEMFIQSLLSYYTTPLFLSSALWLLVFGFMMHLFVILSLTKLSLKSAALMIYRFHAFSVFVAALMGPLVATLFSKFLSLFNTSFSSYLCCDYSSFLGMVLCLYLVSTYFFCASFSTVKCHILERWLFVANLATGTIGYFVIKHGALYK